MEPIFYAIALGTALIGAALATLDYYTYVGD